MKTLEQILSEFKARAEGENEGENEGVRAMREHIADMMQSELATLRREHKQLRAAAKTVLDHWLPTGDPSLLALRAALAGTPAVPDLRETFEETRLRLGRPVK